MSFNRPNTTVTQAGNITTVTLYSTPILTFGDNQIILNNGGWPTSTTKTRINEAADFFGLGFRVYQDHGIWYTHQSNGNNYPFVNGICQFTP